MRTQGTSDLPAVADAEVHCNACGIADATRFFHLPHLPVHVGVFYDDRESAQQTRMGKIDLAYCHHCGHVFNQSFDPGLIAYRPGYEVALHHSPVFRNFMESVAQRLSNKYKLQNKTILEIGAGSAWFLELLCSQGNNFGIGIDPTINRPGLHKYDGYRLELIQDIFDDRFQPTFSQHQPDFVCCLSVLEHIPVPHKLAHDLRQMIQDPSTAVYFEIFNAFRAFQNREIWSIHYEQCSYFCERSFCRLFRNNGFHILESGGCYGENQYLFVDCLADPSYLDFKGVDVKLMREKTRVEEDAKHSLPEEIAQFESHFHERCQFWDEHLTLFRAQNKKVVFWGTGGKGVTFLNICPISAMIDFAVEINPDKHDKYVPGSAQRIVAPSFLVNYQPDVIIISNALYEREIRQQAAELGLECEFYVA